ncbi:MAG: hypothetical protein WDO74_04630 [Pseudomonadota bacterium]
MSNTVKIRPFEEYIEAEPGFSAVVISGGISDRKYVVRALETQLEIETTEVGEDQWGPFAVVKECDVLFSREFRLRLESDAEETMLNVFIPGDGLTGTASWSKRAFSVWFNSSGVKDGKGSSLSRSGKSKPVSVN